MTDNLLPCPYCGNKDIDLALYYDFYRFHCSNPDCYAHMTESQIYRGSGMWYGTVGQARDAWNTRKNSYSAIDELNSYFGFERPIKRSDGK